MTKKVAVINDLSGFGKCSLTAAIPVLSIMGIQCCPLPTAVLTGQTGYTHYHFKDLTDMIPEYTDAWNKNHASFDGIYSGFLTGHEQISHVADFLDTFQKTDTFVLVDPVMGDDGKVYGIYSKELLDGMRMLTSRATIITPNLMEACLLADIPFEQIVSYSTQKDRLSAIEDLGHQLLRKAPKNQIAVITGIKFYEKEKPSICNLAISANHTCCMESPFVEKSFSGTGDLLASTLCGCILNGMSIDQSLSVASNFIYHSIQDTLSSAASTCDGIEFEKNLRELILK